MTPGLIRILFVVAFSAALAYGLRRGAAGLLPLYVFAVPWFGVQANFGLALSLDRIVAVAMMSLLLAQAPLRAFKGFGVFFAFVVVNTVAQGFVLPESVSEYPPLQGEWRWVFQLFMWAMLITPAGVIAATGSECVVRRCLRVLVLSATILSVLGILQFAVYSATSIDIFPIGMFDPSGETRSALFDSDGAFLGGRVFRAGSLGGEPKHFAYTLSFVMAILAAEWLFGEVLAYTRRRLVIASLVCGSALVLTFSTQGIVLCGANAALLFGGSLVWKGRSRPKGKVLLALACVAIALLGVPGVFDVLRERSVDRIAATGWLEDWNEAVLSWLLASPWSALLGVGLGNVHLHAAPYIPSQYLYYMGGHVFTAKAGVLRLITETGVVGLALFTAAAWGPIGRVMSQRSKGGLYAAIPLIAMAAVGNFMVSTAGPFYVFLAVGLCRALASAANRGMPVTKGSLSVRPLGSAMRNA